jgi:hypothetical protein
MRKKYVVELTEQEREYLHKLISAGSSPARKLNRSAHPAENRPRQTRRGRGVHRPTDRSDARDLHGHSPKGARTLLRGRSASRAGTRSKPDRVYKRSLEGRAEAHLIALACSEPPRGRDRWSLRLLADKAVELGIVEKVSHETVRKTLKKTSSSLTSSSNG